MLTQQAWERDDQGHTDSPRHLFRLAVKAHREGECAWAEMTTREKVSVALVLNRADWLRRTDYTIADAMARAGSEWVRAMPRISHLIQVGGAIDDASPHVN